MLSACLISCSRHSNYGRMPTALIRPTQMDMQDIHQKHPLLALPEMLRLVQSQLQSWPAGLSSASNDLPSLKHSSGSRLPPIPPRDILISLAQESQRRSSLFTRGITHYVYSPYPGPQPRDVEVIQTEYCNFRIYHSSLEVAKSRPILLCIPSLINRYTILDLNKESSVVEYLNRQGFDCYIAEWHEPKAKNANESMADYVLKLIYALQEQWEHFERPLVAVGYCMGGVLATALAQLFSRIHGLALLATPWAYSAYPSAAISDKALKRLDETITSQPLLPAEKLQVFLYMTNSHRLYQRYSSFSQMKDEEKIAHFVAVEHWANDGIAITQRVAQECLLEWPRKRILEKGEWGVDGESIWPETLSIPSFVALPEHDYIVPSESAEPLAKLLTRPTIVRPGSGHVGMLVGSKRRELLSPLSEWLLHYFG